MKPVHFLLPAEEEMLEAAFYYEQQSTGLGKDFLNKIKNAVDDIAQHPDRWPKTGSNIRRRMIHRFPYQIRRYLFSVTLSSRWETPWH